MGLTRTADPHPDRAATVVVDHRRWIPDGDPPGHRDRDDRRDPGRRRAGQVHLRRPQPGTRRAGLDLRRRHPRRRPGDLRRLPALAAPDTADPEGAAHPARLDVEGASLCQSVDPVPSRLRALRPIPFRNLSGVNSSATALELAGKVRSRCRKTAAWMRRKAHADIPRVGGRIHGSDPRGGLHQRWGFLDSAVGSHAKHSTQPGGNCRPERGGQGADQDRLRQLLRVQARRRDLLPGPGERRVHRRAQVRPRLAPGADPDDGRRPGRPGPRVRRLRARLLRQDQDQR